MTRIAPTALIDLIRQHGIDEIAVLDDQLRPPSAKDVQSAACVAIAEAYFGVEKPEQDLLAQIFGTTPEEHGDVTREMVWKLLGSTLEQRSEMLSNAVEVARQSLIPPDPNLETFFQCVEKDFDIKTSKHHDLDVEQLVASVSSSAKIVFVDYVFGPPSEESRQRSSSIVQALAQRKPAPMIVLMSDSPPADEDEVAFVERSSVIRGKFRVVHKQVLGDKFQLCVELQDLLRSLPLARLVQGLLDALPERTNIAIGSLVKEMHRLTIGDLWNLNTVTLRTDGQSLGQYLLWLVTANLAAKFEEQFVDQLAILDLESVPAAQFPSRPSGLLTELHHNAVYMRQGALAIHPHGHEKGWDLSLGDLFRPDTLKFEVWLVLSPECDLARARTKSEKAKLSVWMMPGTLVRAIHGGKTPIIATDLLRIGNEDFQVEWDPHRSIFVPFDEISTFRPGFGATRIARMRPLHALHMQRKYLEQFGRVGIPVPTPSMEDLDVTILRMANGEREVIRVFSPGAVLYRTRNEKSELSQAHLKPEVLAFVRTEAEKRPPTRNKPAPSMSEWLGAAFETIDWNDPGSKGAALISPRSFKSGLQGVVGYSIDVAADSKYRDAPPHLIIEVRRGIAPVPVPQEGGDSP